MICSLLVFFPPFIYGNKSSTSFYFGLPLLFEKQKDFILTSQLHEDRNSFRERWVPLQGKLWHEVMTLRTHPGLFVHTDSTVFYFRFTGRDYLPWTFPWQKSDTHWLQYHFFSVNTEQSIPSFLSQHLET